MQRARRLLSLALLSTAAACSVDAPIAPRASAAAREAVATSAFPLKDVLRHYVSIGTSISMGWTADGILSATQQASWPSQLAALGGIPMRLPLIDATGCPAPIAAPLALALRISGESAAIPASSPLLNCTNNSTGVVLPAQNVAIYGALTAQALLSTPSTVSAPLDQRLYARVLPPTLSQVGAMVAQRPALVSVELGSTEVLGARSGVLIPGVTTVQVPVWYQAYRALLNTVQATAHYTVIVGLVNHVDALPGVRRGNELWLARATFAPLNVAIDPNCANSQNLLFTAFLIPSAAVQGAQRAPGNPFVISCANAPSSSLVQDYILSPQEVLFLDDVVAEMNKKIKFEAAARGFAYFELGALYEVVNQKGPLDAFSIMTSQQPYGPYFSVDGVHPTAAGNSVLAAAAAAALNAKYGFGLP